MLRLAADENFNGDMIRGLLRRSPSLDIVRVQDVGLSGQTILPFSNGLRFRGGSSLPTAIGRPCGQRRTAARAAKDAAQRARSQLSVLVEVGTRHLDDQQVSHRS